MAEEVLEAWRPVEGLPDVMYVEALHDDYEGLRILLRSREPAGRMLRLLFESAVGYRNVNETFRHATWTALSSGQPRPSLLVVRNSRWIQWLVFESGGLLDGEALTHYAIYTPEDCIDLATAFPPDVEWLNL